MLNITATREGLRLDVIVQPRSSRNQIVGEFNGALKIKLTAPPVEGEANQALVVFLSKELKLAKNRVKITQGESSRHKTVAIKAMTPDEFKKTLGL